MASKTISTIEAGLGHDSGALQAIYKEIEGYSYVIKALDKDVGRLRRLHHLNLTTKKYLWEYVQVKQLRRKAVETRRRLNLAIKDHHYLNSGTYLCNPYFWLSTPVQSHLREDFL